MILEQRTGISQLVESRTEFGSSIPPTWAQMQSGWNGFDGTRATSLMQAVTVPTIIGGLQFISASAAALPFIIYRGHGADKDPQYDSWQFDLLERSPGIFSDPFQLKFDIFWSLESTGNAFILKVKDPKTKIPKELVLLDPDRVAIRNDKGEKKFDIQVSPGVVYKGATPNEILHIKLLPKVGTMFTGTCGIKLISARLGNELSASEWEGRFFDNDATPPLVITLGDDAGTDEMKEALESWQIAHAGPYNAGNPAILGSGAKVEKLGFNLADAQLIELHTFNVMEFSRAMNLPITLFIPPHTKPQGAEDEGLILTTFYLGPRLRRVESAFNADADMFTFSEGLWCRFDEREMLRANTLAMAQANHSYVQDGVLLPDEVRSELGYAPLPPIPQGQEAIDNPGQIPQITPVGGAPNDPNSGNTLVQDVPASSDE